MLLLDKEQTSGGYSTEEKTRAQVLTGDSFDGTLTPDPKTSGRNWFDKVEKMRRQPTVALARELVCAPLLASQWAVETKDGAPPDAKEFIEDNMLPLRVNMLRSSLFGCIDYGWQGYEKIFELDMRVRRIKIKKMKPLLQRITKILVFSPSGAFAGFRQDETQPAVDLQLENALLVNTDVEGTYWYGIPKFAAVETGFDNWSYCNEANIRYDKKLAGAHWIIYYPVGQTRYNGIDDVENDSIAKDLLNKLESSGCMAIPQSIGEFVNNANESSQKRQWEIELKSAYPTSNVAFVDRLKYCDSLMVRAMGMPERAVLEGQFGTKAEAEAHADFAITNMELRHEIIVQQYNWHIVNQLLRINYGEEFENTVWLKPAPITDLKLQYIREIYKAFLTNPEGFASEVLHVDLEAMRDQLGIPTLSDEARQTKDVKDAVAESLSFMKQVFT